NFHVRTESSASGIRAALVHQIEAPVRWAETVLKMAADGIDKLVECGPGKVLSGLNKRIVKEVQTLPVHDPDSLQQALVALGP
ncbi:MAG: ACP S-malonyltransferase, partial [Acidiferrobacterales bacterium]